MRNRRLMGAGALVVMVAFVVARTTAGPNGSGSRHHTPSKHNPQTHTNNRYASGGAGRKGHARRRARVSAACPPPREVLDGVYHPARLRLIDPCRRVRGRVLAFKREEDGDLHIRLRPDRPARGLLMAANLSEQRGSLVVEFMPRDRGHLPAPKPGDQLSLVGAYVDDLDHSWAELHPVWQVSINGGRAHRSGPQFGGSPPSARSEISVVSCRTATGERCRGFAGPPSYLGPGGGGGVGGPAGDRDCSDFRTQAEAQRYFLSKGGPARDPDRLDGDHNGRACEALPPESHSYAP